MSPKTHRSMISTNTRADSLRPIYSGVPKIRKGNTSSHKLSKKTGLAGLDIVGHNDHDQNKIACKGFDSPSEHSLPQFEPVTKNWVPFDVYHEISQNKYHRRHLNLQRYLCGTSTGLQWINEDLLQVDILQNKDSAEVLWVHDITGQQIDSTSEPGVTIAMLLAEAHHVDKTKVANPTSLLVKRKQNTISRPSLIAYMDQHQSSRNATSSSTLVSALQSPLLFDDYDISDLSRRYIPIVIKVFCGSDLLCSVFHYDLHPNSAKDKKTLEGISIIRLLEHARKGLREQKRVHAQHDWSSLMWQEEQDGLTRTETVLTDDELAEVINNAVSAGHSPVRLHIKGRHK